MATSCQQLAVIVLEMSPRRDEDDGRSAGACTTFDTSEAGRAKYQLPRQRRHFHHVVSQYIDDDIIAVRCA